jgi:hypothetical protein
MAKQGLRLMTRDACSCHPERSVPCHPERSEGSHRESGQLVGIRFRGMSSADEVLVSQDHRNGCDYYGTFAW